LEKAASFFDKRSLNPLERVCHVKQSSSARMESRLALVKELD
jgi:hypothetical protein